MKKKLKVLKLKGGWMLTTLQKDDFKTPSFNVCW